MCCSILLSDKPVEVHMVEYGVKEEAADTPGIETRGSLQHWAQVQVQSKRTRPARLSRPPRQCVRRSRTTPQMVSATTMGNQINSSRPPLGYPKLSVRIF
jgi:hypothetical protein